MVSASICVDMAGFETLNEARGKLMRAAAALNARNVRGRGLPPIILMTDDTRVVDWVEAVGALPAGCAVVVRHRDAHAREALARRLSGVCSARRIKLMIADDPGLAVRIRADGVHLPQRRASQIAAIKTLNRHWLVTAAAHDERSARAAARVGADAVLVAPVFRTASHPGGEALGVVRLAAISGKLRSAAYALGGVNEETIQSIADVPLCGVALIGGWTG